MFKRTFSDALKTKSCGDCHFRKQVLSHSMKHGKDRLKADSFPQNRETFSRRVWGNGGPNDRPSMCIDDPVRTPSGRPAVVRALHNDGRIDIRYTDELRDPGCTLSAALLVKRAFKRPSAAVPRPSMLERGWLPGQQW